MDAGSFPVAIFQLDADYPEFHHQDGMGRSPRYMIEQLDGDRFFFTTREAANDFAAVHGMEAVSDNQMTRLRLNGDTP